MKDFSKKTFRNTIITSSLIICLCMLSLVGGTFAWFTDQVQSDTNRIVSGNLDVEMYFKNPATVEANEEDPWANVTGVGTDPHFFVNVDGDDMLWEPNATSVCNLKVVNKGNLALKYQFKTSFKDYNTAENLNAKLSSVIKAAIIPTPETPITDTASALAAVAAATPEGGNLWNNLAIIAHEDHLSGYTVTESGKNYDSDEFTVVLYWEPTDHDNDYNMKNELLGKEIGIDIDIKLVAMQYTEEKDAFDDQYDKDATYPGGENQASALVFDSEDSTIVSGIAEGDTSKLLSIPPTATKIAANAFKDNENIEELEMPASIEVGEGAFEGCSNLKKVRLVVEDGAKVKIDTKAFAQCPSLESFEIDGNSVVGQYGFLCDYDNSWDSLDVVFNGNTKISGAAFAQNGTVLGDSTITFNGDVDIDTSNAGGMPSATFIFSSIEEIRFAAGKKITINGNCTNDVAALKRVVFEGLPAEGSTISANAFAGAKGGMEGVYIGNCTTEQWAGLGLPTHFNGEYWSGGDVIVGLPEA